MPKEDRISERQIAKLLRDPATQAQAPVFPTHFAYALAARRVSQYRVMVCAVIVLAVVSSVVGLQFWLAPVIAVVVWLAWSCRKKRALFCHNAFALSGRFGTV